MLTKLLMLGPALDARGGVASVVAAYRDHGLFTRWPAEYVGGRPRELLRALAGLRRAVIHLHVQADVRFWQHVAAAAAALAARCPVLLHLHGSGFERLQSTAGEARRAAVRFLFTHAACVAASSHRLVSWVRAVAPGAHAVWVPHPVGAAAAAASARQNLVLFLGRLAPDKGIFDLLEAVSQLRAAVPDVRLVCAGEGGRIAVARHAERLGIADAVKFTGWVGPSGKRALFDAAAAFALPSYCEGMPVSLLEAMAAGVPVVASPVGGVPEVVTDGVTGYLAAPGDVATLARALRKLLIERDAAARLGAAGRETTRLRFAPERALPRLEALYAELGLRALEPGPRPMALES